MTATTRELLGRTRARRVVNEAVGASLAHDIVRATFATGSSYNNIKKKKVRKPHLAQRVTGFFFFFSWPPLLREGHLYLTTLALVDACVHIRQAVAGTDRHAIPIHIDQPRDVHRGKQAAAGKLPPSIPRPGNYPRIGFTQLPAW